MTLVPVPAFADNYLRMLQDGSRAIVVGPGNAKPVVDALASNRLQLAAILVTHHHDDVTGGVVGGNADPARYRALCEAQRVRGAPTLPSQMAAERRINPFLRSREATAIAALRAHAGLAAQASEPAVFVALREWKNSFQ